MQGEPGRRTSMCRGLEAGGRKGSNVFIDNENLSEFGTLWEVAELR